MSAVTYSILPHSAIFTLLVWMTVTTVCNAMHRELTPLQLQHIFGVSHSDKVPSYWQHTPTISDWLHEAEKFVYEIELEGRRERFLLQRKSSIIGQKFHMVLRDDENSSLSHHFDDLHCIYQGTSLERNHTVIALTGCGDEKLGFVAAEDGSYYLIHPKPTTSANEHSHVIHKRSPQDSEHTCLFDASNDPYPLDRMDWLLSRSQQPEFLAVLKDSDLTIELAVFVDEELWNHFIKMHEERADAQLHKFIMAAVNNIDVLYTQRSIQPHVNIRIVRYEVMKKLPTILNPSIHSGGDVDRLLDAFCRYQHEINPPSDADPRHWDHALLFSGYDLYRDSQRTVAGYAPVKGMCSGWRSCTINEGLDFGSVFVTTHEIGHALGMYHDGATNECDASCCIMSPSVGNGKTKWSSCSVSEMTAFVTHLGSKQRAPQCLRDEPDDIRSIMAIKDKEFPGQIFTLDEQCEIFHGECWKHEYRDGQQEKDVCGMLWCGNGEGLIRTSHPALEGSYCGQGMVCRYGKCVEAEIPLPVVAGGFSEWNDLPSSAACGGECVSCQVEGQIRVRRSIRRCSNPFKNNGGEDCMGDSARGLRCDKKICKGFPSPIQYANNICNQIRNDPVLPNPEFSGEGMQYAQAPCKVWYVFIPSRASLKMNCEYFMCLVAHTNTIRTVANYPDGSPCGEGNYCIKGECRPLLCRGSTIARSIIDCPAKFAASPSTQALLSRKRRPFKSGTMHAVVHNGSTKGNPLKPSKSRASKIVQSGGVLTNSTTDHPSMKQWTRMFPTREKASEWTEWSPFSECISYACGVPGMKVRVRKCKSGTKCVGPSRERVVCRIPCGNSPQITPPPVTERKSSGGLIRGIESQDKITQQLSVWGSWSECSKSCGVGIRQRRKKFCKTNCFDYSNCSLGACPTSPPPEAEAEPPAQQRAAESVSVAPAAESPVSPAAPEDTSTLPPSTPSTSPHPETGRYTEWSNWNKCSSCDSIRSRVRVCVQVYCNRPLREDQLCNTVLPDCPLFTSWSEWSICGGGCEGSGRRHRRRTCYKGVCKGFDAESEPCFNPTCKKRIRRVTKVSNSVNTRGRGGGRNSGII